MNENTPSKRLVEQRIRNRLIEYLELVTAENNVLESIGLNEIINQWFDWNPDDLTIDNYSAPPYSQAETLELIKVGKSIEALVAATPNDIANFAHTVKVPEWLNFVSKSKAALDELIKRGKLSEDG